jgi:hypothetical protein
VPCRSRIRFWTGIRFRTHTLDSGSRVCGIQNTIPHTRALSDAPHPLHCYSDGNSQYSGAAQFAEALDKLNTTAVHHGVCVQCINECDCPVNQFCGYDFQELYTDSQPNVKYKNFRVTIPPVQSKNEGAGKLSAHAKRVLAAYSKQFEGLPIPSICKDYGKQLPAWTQCDVNLQLDPFAKMVEESLMTAEVQDLYKTCEFADDAREYSHVSKRTPRSWPREGRKVSYRTL